MGGHVPVISGAVEGIVDEAIFRRLVRAVRGEPGPVHGKSGKHQLLQRLPGYNSAARLSAWLVDDDRTPLREGGTEATAYSEYSHSSKEGMFYYSPDNKENTLSG